MFAIFIMMATSAIIVPFATSQGLPYCAEDCNKDNDCANGDCLNKQGDMILGITSSCAGYDGKVCTGNRCLSSGQCSSGRCDFYPVTNEGINKVCIEKLENCVAGCNEHTDCKSGKCLNRGFGNASCSGDDGKLCTGERCRSSGQCSSGRCDRYKGLKKICMERLDKGARCNENSDCKSNNCKRRKCK